MKIVDLGSDWGRNAKGRVIEPRRWQRESTPTILSHLAQERPQRSIVRAIMGGGKTTEIAQIVASIQLSGNEVIVVSTPTIALVEDLEAAIKLRLEQGFSLSEKVGTYYTNGKNVTAPVIVTCMPSLPALADLLRISGRRCVLWICDEAHRTQTRSAINAHEILMPERVLGFTATPFLANENKSLSLFEKLIYELTAKQALDDKIVVPWRIVGYEGDECSVNAAALAMTKDAKGPGIFNAKTIDDAVAFAKILTESNHPNSAIHSRLKVDQKREIISLWRQRKLRSVTHVSMLQEGVNYPFIRWSCLRREVSSRVRFAQEAGRALRADDDAAPGDEKTVATFYDPLGLFERFSLTYEEMLGGDLLAEEEPVEKESKRRERSLQSDAMEVVRHIAEVKASDGKIPLKTQPLVNYLTELVNVFDVCGLIERKIASRDWRGQGSSMVQHSTIKNLKWATELKQVPRLHQKALGALTEYGFVMKKGSASDLISIEMALADKRKWADFEQLDRAAEEGMEREEKKKVSVVKPEPQAAKIAPRPASKPAAMIQGDLFETEMI